MANAYPFAGNGVHIREIELLITGSQAYEKVENFIEHLVGARGWFVDFVDDDEYFQTKLKGLSEYKFGLRHGAFVGIHHKHRCVHCAKNTFHFGTEIGVPGSIHNVDLIFLVVNGRIFCINGDSAFFFLIVRVHHSHFHFFVRLESTSGFKQGIHECGFSMVYVSDDGNVSDFHNGGILHEKTGLAMDY